MEAEVSKGLVLMFRAPKEVGADLFEQELAKHNLSPHSIPVLEFKFTNIETLADSLARHGEFSTIIFTSPRSVEATGRALQLLEGPEEKSKYNITDLRCYVVGKGTHNSAKEAGFQPKGMESGNAENLAQSIIEDIRMEEITVYETGRNPNVNKLVEDMVEKQGIPEYIVYFSPSGVQYTADLFTRGLLPLHKVKVMPILLTILDRRFVTFQSLVIFINKGKCGSDNRNDATLGYTSVKSSKRQEVHIYLKHHVSDIHFLGTLLHELGHCFVETFENGGHTDEWLQTTNKLMHLINYYIDDIPVLDSIRHDLCAVSIGPNYCDKFVEFQINV